MTNAELIAKIQAEIERIRKQDGNPYYPSETADQYYARGVHFTCDNLLSFLSTLEESGRPEPYNPVYDEAYLNEKIKKATESWKRVDVDAMLAECRGYDEEKSEKPNQEGLEKELDKWRHIHFNGERDGHFSGEYLERTSQLDLARHFAQWGAEHLKK